MVNSSMRVSTQEQNVESKRLELRRFIKSRKDLRLVAEYEDKISGVTERRAQLDKLMIAANVWNDKQALSIVQVDPGIVPGRHLLCI